MNTEDHELAMVRDLRRAGFSLTEMTAFFAALDKPLDDLTGAEWALIRRYEAAGADWRAA